MKTGSTMIFATLDAVRGVFQLHTCSAVFSNNISISHILRSKMIRTRCLPDTWCPDLFQYCFALKIWKRKFYRDFTGQLGPVIYGKEVSNRIENPFFTP